MISSLTIKRTLRSIITVATAVILMLSSAETAAQTGTWKNHLAYHELQQIVKAGDCLFVRASNSLYRYGLNDGEVLAYDKVNGLNDTHISLIEWNQSAARLLIVYDNSNIDLLDLKSEVVNISGLYSKSMTGSKTVNNILMSGNYAYLATAFGIVKTDMSRAEISETYQLGQNVTAMGLTSTHIYAQTDGGILAARLTDNLQNSNNWTAATTVPDGIFTPVTNLIDTYRTTVSQLMADSPRYNNIGSLNYKYGKLWTTTGQSLISEQPIYVQNYDDADDKWTFFNTDLYDVVGHRIAGASAIDINPTDKSIAAVASQTGIYIFKDGLLDKHYTLDNSPLEAAMTVKNPTNKNYVIALDCKYDQNGSLWVLNSISTSTSILELKPDGTWQSHHNDKLIDGDGCSLQRMYDLQFDSRGLMWFINVFHVNPTIVCYNPSTKQLKTYDSFVNQDGTVLTKAHATRLREDKEGNMWVATNNGLMYIPAEEVTETDNQLYQFKVPRNDGSNYADYLMGGISLTSMAIDGGNRKWIGTDENGLYLISSDNMEEIHHFTTENSPLLSNNIIDITINPDNGTVYIATELGLCSFKSDATEAASEPDNAAAFAYPNPVPPGYNGLITVNGLTYNADVKIINAAGKLIASGRSNGGTFTWDGTDRHGQRVGSGIYYVVSSTEEGKKGVVTKIAIIN